MEIVLHILLFIMSLVILGIGVFLAKFLLFFIARLAGGAILLCIASVIFGFGISWTVFFIGCGVTLIYYWYSGELMKVIGRTFGDIASYRSSSRASNSYSNGDSDSSTHRNKPPGSGNCGSFTSSGHCERMSHDGVWDNRCPTYGNCGAMSNCPYK